MPDWLAEVFGTLLQLLPGGLWCAWWLWAVDWRKTWTVLAQGAWAPVVLIGALSAYAWSRVSPSECTCLRLITVPNFWWQLGSVSALVAVALFCGWLQDKVGWAPAEVDLSPPVARHDHGHH
jgi:hypothetical protein